MARSSSDLVVRRRALRPQTTPMPTHIEPMLAVLGEFPRTPSDYAFEYKWDGVRALCFANRGRVTLHSRNQLDITRRYPELAQLGSSLRKGGNHR